MLDYAPGTGSAVSRLVIDKPHLSEYIMLWFYTRNQETLTLELRYDNDTQEYVATTTGERSPIPQTTRFRTNGQFRAWLEAFERKMTGTSWKVDGPPHILADGWPDKPPPR